MKKLLSLISITLTIFLAGCRTVPSVSLQELSASNYSVVILDLSSPAIEIAAYPEESGWTRTKSVEAFAKETGCSIAINTNQFQKKHRFAKHGKIIGTHVSKGIEYAEPDSRYAKISFYKEETGFSAKIYDSQTEKELSAPAFSAGGYWTILRDDTIFQFKNIKNNRCAAGLSENGRFLYLLCGRKLSFMDCANILRQKGAYTAMEFDGGHHCNMYFNRKKRLHYAFAKNPAAILGFRNILSIKID